MGCVAHLAYSSSYALWFLQALLSHFILHASMLWVVGDVVLVDGPDCHISSSSSSSSS
jgi:hypothetical protein